MDSHVYCLDTNVIVKALVPEDDSEKAGEILREAVSSGARIIAPAFAWAEVGTVIRKKVRSGHLTESDANAVWERFLALSIDYIQNSYIAPMAWKTSLQYGLPTMYDSAFFAVCEWVRSESAGPVEFWTADKELINSLGHSMPAYVKSL